jgi:3-dehydroquinate dehydratase
MYHEMDNWIAESMMRTYVTCMISYNITQNKWDYEILDKIHDSRNRTLISFNAILYLLFR